MHYSIAATDDRPEGRGTVVETKGRREFKPRAPREGAPGIIREQRDHKREAVALARTWIKSHAPRGAHARAVVIRIREIGGPDVVAKWEAEFNEGAWLWRQVVGSPSDE